MSLSLIVGHAQRRVKRPRIAITAAGVDWDGPYWEDTWVDPLTETLMLRPPALYSEWWTTNAGNYAKPAKSAYTLSDAGHWREEDTLGAGAGKYLVSKSDVAGAWAAIPIAAKNRPVTLGLQTANAGDDYIAAQVGWGAAGTPNVDSGVRLDVWASGLVTAWRDGVYVGRGGIGSITGKLRTLLLIPGRHRELLVFRTDAAYGGEGVVSAFRVVFEAVLETDDDPIIVPAGQFYVKVPQASEVYAQIVPMKFPTTGFATTIVAELMQPPPTGATLETFDNLRFPAETQAMIYGHPSYVGSSTATIAVVTESNGAFVANGLLGKARLKATLGGSGSYTPFLYGAHTAWAAEFKNTDDSAEREILPDVLGAGAGSVDLDVPDDPGGVRLSMTVADPASIEDEVPLLRLVARRPVAAWIGDAQLIDGLSDPPTNEPDYEPEADTMPWSWRDGSALLETAQFREPIPFDGMPFAEPCHEVGTENDRSAVRLLVCDIGGWPPERTRMSSSGYRLDDIPGDRAGDWNFQGEVGSDAWSALRRMIDSHAQGWHWGFRPWTGGALFELLDPADLEPGPHATVYESYEDAIAEEGEDPEDPEAIDNVHRLLIEDWRETPIEIEGNEVRVTGLDPRTGRAIQAYRIDAVSQDPELPPGMYPENWLGFAKVVGATLRRLTSKAAIERAAEGLYDAVTIARYLACWEGFMLFRDDGEGNQVPVWRGDVVEVFERGSYRIASLSVQSTDEPFDVTGFGADRIWRRARYVGVRTGSGPAVPRGYGGTSIEEMRQRAREAAVAHRLGDIRFVQTSQASRVVAVP